MKFLVLGCNGMAGHLISLHLSERGHSVLGLDLSKSRFINSVAVDVRDTALLAQVIREGEFDSVINCIGILNQFAEEKKSLAVFLNSYLPHFLADVTQRTNTQIIHMSTDCVFSGSRGCYAEDDFRDGTTFYDRSKALGELEDDKNITIRCSIVGPDLSLGGIGLLNWFMKQDGLVSGFTRAMWTGQTTLQLAKTMESASVSRAYGLYNAVPDYAISKHDLLCLFNQYLRGGKLTVRPSRDVVSDKSLKRTRYGFSFEIPDYEEMVVEMAEWIKKHIWMYPHYESQVM